MKHLRLYSVIAIVIAGIITSCKDEDIQLVPEWETGVHGFGRFATGSPTNFVYQNASTALNVDLRWVSIDGANTVTKIEVFVLFNEPYIDPDGNPVIANHGGTAGKLLATYSDSAVPANRTNMTIPITQNSIYELYKTATFDYDKNSATAPTPVFTNPAVPGRSAASPFVKGDAFNIRWEFTTADGRKFTKWGVSVCTEYPGGNCAVAWGVICASNLAGTYNVVSEFVSVDYGFSSAAPDFQYGPGNDGSVANGVQTYNGIAITAGTAAATYIIPDITNGFEPIMWGNPAVRALVADQCGNLVLVQKLGGPSYAYAINAGSKVNSDGSLTIKWSNPYNESGTSTFTKVP
jgi:hypothetical protein